MDDLTSADFDHRPVMRLPFATAPCRCVKRHAPRPLTTELHHPFPQALQKKIFGYVRFKETVPLCPNAHTNVHLMFDALMRGDPLDQRGNTYQEQLAQRGYEMYQAALKTTV
jgi:hypothetical protein